MGMLLIVALFACQCANAADQRLRGQALDRRVEALMKTAA